MDCSTPGLPVRQYLPEFAQVDVHCIGDAIQSSHPLLLPSILPSIRDFSNKSSVRIRWPKYWSLSFSISPSSEYSGLISLKIVWFDLLAVQGTFRSLLQHHSLKASIIWCSPFFMVQLSQLYMTTGKTTALTIWTFVSRVIMSLLFNALSRFVFAFWSRSNYLLISRPQSLSAVILELPHDHRQLGYLSKRDPSSQSYCFSSSHVWMWELDYKERGAPKNWYFWIVVLEKTLESPLGCKEIKPVSLKGNQSWIFIERTDAEAEAPMLWPPDVKNWPIGKDLDAGKDWRQEEKGTTEDEMVGWHHWLGRHEFE